MDNMNYLGLDAWSVEGKINYKWLIIKCYFNCSSNLQSYYKNPRHERPSEKCVILVFFQCNLVSSSINRK